LDNNHDLPLVPPKASFFRLYLPEDRQALLDINGVGTLKQRRYGEGFLVEIRGYLAGR
jgi:hypothetical protein